MTPLTENDSHRHFEVLPKHNELCHEQHLQGLPNKQRALLTWKISSYPSDSSLEVVALSLGLDQYLNCDAAWTGKTWTLCNTVHFKLPFLPANGSFFNCSFVASRGGLASIIELSEDRSPTFSCFCLVDAGPDELLGFSWGKPCSASIFTNRSAIWIKFSFARGWSRGILFISTVTSSRILSYRRLQGQSVRYLSPWSTLSFSRTTCPEEHLSNIRH